MMVAQLLRETQLLRVALVVRVGAILMQRGILSVDPPRLQAQGNVNLDPKVVRQKRRLRLRLPSPPPPHAEHSESEHDDPADDDFAPHVEIHAAEQGCSRKRRRHQPIGGCSTHGTAPAHAPAHAPAAGPPPAPAPAPADAKKRTNQAIRCSPGKFRDMVNALDDPLKDAIRAKNFGGLLDFKPRVLDRQLLSWLMRRLNQDTMTLELEGDQRISITQHTVWCVFQLPRDGGGPPEMTDAEARLRQRELAAEITGQESDRISPPEIEKLFASRTLAGDIGLRAFFMCAFQSLLFSNSSCYIRLDDVKYTEDMQNIGQMNWCKVVVDNLSQAARLYKLDFESKGMAAPISGCGIFLVMLYIDFLQHGYDLNTFALPRCAHLETNMIDRISSEDRRGDVAPGTVLNFGHLRLKNINDTCYRLPHPALAVGAVPIAPAARFESYPGPSTSVRPSASVGTSQHVPAASHDPGGQAGFNLQPPGPFKYPSLSAAFKQGIIDVVGRSRKSQAMKILEDFDASALEAQSLEAKAVSFMNMASMLMSKAHHECYTGIQKLIEDAKAQKQAANAARSGRQRNAAPDSGMPSATDQAAEVEQPVQEPAEAPVDDDEQVVEEPTEAPADNPEQHLAADGGEINEQGEHFDAQPLETLDEDTGIERGDEFVEGLFASPCSEDSNGGDDGRNPDDQGNDDFMDTVISTPPALRGPSSGVDSIISNMYSSEFVDQEAHQQENTERQIVVVNTEEFMFDSHGFVNQQESVHSNPEEPSADVDGDGKQRRPESIDPAEDMGRASADVDMTDNVHTVPPVHEPSRAVSGDIPDKERGSEGTNAAVHTELLVHEASRPGSGDVLGKECCSDGTNAAVEKDDTTNKHVDETSVGAGNKGVGDNTSGGAVNKGVGDSLKKDVVAQEHGTTDTTMLDVCTGHVAKLSLEKPLPAIYTRRTTRATRAAEASKRKSVDANKAKQLDAAVVKEEKRLQAERKKEEKRLDAERKKEEKRLAAARKKVEKKEQERLEAEREKAFLEEAGIFMDQNEREKRDEHERRMQMLREDAEQEIDLLKSTVDVLAGPSAPAPEQVFPEDADRDIYSQSLPVRLSQEERTLGSKCHNQFQRFIYRQVGDRLRRRPRKFLSPFKIATSRPKVPKERALAMRTRIANDQNLQEMTLLDFSIFLSYTGKELLTTFADNESGENNLLDYIVHCLRFDDIVHKQDSIGYRVFLTTGLWTAVKDVEQEYMDDGKTETVEFKRMREHLEVLVENYELTKAKLIFMPVCDGCHYFLYCINLIHNRIDILDSIDYWWNQGAPMDRH
ncbi:unnamed protein product [Urochloa decumbens]|uniref:Ubiquitin-like protease family profile domain-containing protein n=1 Tax=Urochloa decumbens TaxID=240449 RepID=A0ABC9B7S5_9POAL